MMKQQFERVLLVLIFLFLCLPVAVSQEKLKFRIVDFGEDQFDFSAKDPKYEKRDGNGERMAIIKVTSNNPNDDLKAFNFNFGNMRHQVEERDGVLWVYVQRNAKMVTITRDGYAPIHRYDLHTTIESGKNYVMSLSSESKKVLMQMVRFNVQPAAAKAVVMVKSTAQGSQEELFGNVVSGSVAKSLEYGTYTYKVVADNYHLCEGKFTLNDKNQTMVEDVTLRPNFSQMTFVVDANADIYINGEKKGVRKWSGILKAGNYQVECRQANHKPTSQYVTVEENDNRTITLTAPVPILGTVAVTSMPLGATIKIDGKDYGVTPKNLDIVTGLHNIELSMTGYEPSKDVIEVKETATTQVNLTLGRMTQVKINSSPSYALVRIDGKEIGRSPVEYRGEVGTHHVEIDYGGYKPFKKNVYIGSQPIMNFTLSKRYVWKWDYYVALGAGAGSTMVATAALGAHWNNYNLEIYYSYGLQKSPTIYWNSIDVEDNYGYSGTRDPEEVRYRPIIIVGGKFGYGFIAGTRFKITPQIGYRYTRLDPDGSNCSSMTFGVRAYCALSSHFGISLTPEYTLGVFKSEGFKTVSTVVPKINDFGEGFMANLSLVFSW